MSLVKSLGSILILAIATANAASASGLYVIDGSKLYNVQKLVSDGEDLQTSHDFQDYAYCYQGNSDTVVALLKRWKNEGSFYSGGGGLILANAEVAHGSSTNDLILTFQNESSPSEFSTIQVKPCDTWSQKIRAL